MAETEIHKNDVGTAFLVTVLGELDPINLSTTTARLFYLKKPGGTVVSRVPDMPNGGTDGLLRYITIAGDLNEVGFWKLQVYLTFLTGSWYSTVVDFEVADNLV